ncbi:MAG TPA: alpha/beta fold hydrolase [Chloroflexia bacterium]|nr:alpha/beta fold hydrolase [Chloroflexia bacterium]
MFVHGAGGSGDFWELVRPQFPGAWMVDLPGHAAGRTRRPGHVASLVEQPLESIDTMADWLMEQVAARSLTNVVLVGHSMGGGVVQAVAVRQPPWLRGLVLSSTGSQLPVPPTVLRLLEEDHGAAVDWLLEQAFASRPTGYRREGIRRQLLRVPAAVTRADYRACAGFDTRVLLVEGALSGPALVISGAEDRLTPPAASAYLLTHILVAHTAVIARAGHMAPVEQPAAWSEAVLAWARVALTARRQAPQP